MGRSALGFCGGGSPAAREQENTKRKEAGGGGGRRPHGGPRSADLGAQQGRLHPSGPPTSTRRKCLEVFGTHPPPPPAAKVRAVTCGHSCEL